MVVTTSSFPVQVFLGIYLGILTGIVPAVVAWALAFTFRYVTGLTVPSFAVVVLAVAIAGINGGFLAFNDPTILKSANSVTLVTAILVVMLISFYTHNMGDKLGASLPRRLSLGGLRNRTLAQDVVELIEGRNRVRVTVVGEVEGMEGYPPLSPELKATIRTTVGDWTFPAELSIGALEERVSDRLRDELHLSAVSLTIDERGRAEITAAPPLSGISKELQPGRRAVSVTALLPTGIAPGDEVWIIPLGGSDLADVEPIEATVLGASVDTGSTDPASVAPGTDSEDALPDTPDVTAVCPGGSGRLTVAVGGTVAERLLSYDQCAVVVRSRGLRREFELLSLLRRAGQRVRRLTVEDAGPLSGLTLGEANLRERYEVVVLAIREDGTWRIAPRGDTTIAGGADLFAVGTRGSLDAFEEAVA